MLTRDLFAVANLLVYLGRSAAVYVGGPSVIM